MLKWQRTMFSLFLIGCRCLLFVGARYFILIYIIHQQSPFVNCFSQQHLIDTNNIGDNGWQQSSTIVVQNNYNLTNNNIMNDSPLVMDNQKTTRNNNQLQQKPTDGLTSKFH